jgi:myo-inositol 2-dehydrogenase/D-chiro-inositol 1-dehydrogenase
MDKQKYTILHSRMSVISFGLIGYGAWGKCHARAIRETAGAELRAVCASSEISRAAAAAETGAATFGHYTDLLARADIDVVDIVVPNFLHEEIAVAALRSGRHVLLEKPMSTSIGACDRIIGAARDANRLLLVGHEMRFSGMYGRIRELINEERIGAPRYVLADLWRRPYRSGSDGWRLDRERVGNWTLEEPVHFFDIACWYLSAAGEPETVSAYGNQMNSDVEWDPDRSDNFTAVVTFPNRAYAVISQSLAAVEHHFSLKVFGSRGVIRGEWHAELDRSEKPGYSLEISQNGNMRPLQVTSTPGELFELREEIAAMVNAVRDGAPLPIAPEEARRAVALCLKARESLANGGRAENL